MFRQKFLGFTGVVMIAYGIILAVQGNGLALKMVHAAAGVPLWCGLLFIMTGCANLTQVFEKKRKQNDMPFSFTVLICNFLALLVACICIGFITWGAWSAISTTGSLTVMQQDQIEVYSAIIIANIFLLFLALGAMFVDCCISFFEPSGPGEPRQQMYYDYPPRQIPAIYKA